MYINVNQKQLDLISEPTNLCYGEVLLLSLIVGVSIENKFTMNNEAIADFMCASVRTVKRWLTNLNRKGLIQIYYENIAGKETRIIKG